MADTASTSLPAAAVSTDDNAVTDATHSLSGVTASATASTAEPSASLSESSLTSIPLPSNSSASTSPNAASNSASSLTSQISSSVTLSSTRQYDTLSTSATTSSATTGLSSSVATSNSSSNSGLSSNDTKLIIALVCVGAFIGLVVGIYLVRRDLEKRRRAAKSELGGSRPDPSTVGSLAFAPSRDVPLNRGSDLDKYLPIPKADRELAGELQSLGYLVQQHVEDHYHGEPKFTSTGLISQALVDLGLGEGSNTLPGAAQLASMAANPSIRHAALQHIIMRVTFMSLAMNSQCRISLLPSAVMELTRAMPSVEEHVGNAEAISSALTRWRQLSVFLLNAKRSERGNLRPDEGELRAKTKNLIASLNKFLEAFVPKEGRQEQENHLQDVVIECAKFGYIIFSQPAEIAWQFEADKEAGTYIVTCPGLEKVRDQYGVSCARAVIVAPELQKI